MALPPERGRKNKAEETTLFVHTLTYPNRDENPKKLQEAKTKITKREK